MSTNTNIDIIGSGNVAWHLAHALENKGFVIRNIYDRNLTHAQRLANNMYEGEAMDNLDFSESHSQIFIIAISDDAIADIAREIVIPLNAVVIHTSGSQPLSVLDFSGSPNFGVFYPLQTFSKDRAITFKDVPILLEASNSFTKDVLHNLASSISKSVHHLSSEQRKQLHIAAIFASNFTTSLLIHAEELLAQAGLSIDLLHPLITEVTNKGLDMGPGNALTGPAARGDLNVLDDHIQLLEHQPKLQELYRLLSQDILDIKGH